MTRLLAGTPFDRPPRCEHCDELEEECTCPPPAPQIVPPGKQTARLAIEKRKRGKVVTVVRGLHPEETDLSQVLTRLKTVCGAGGRLADEGLEIQGRQLERVRSELRTMGYKIKG